MRGICTNLLYGICHRTKNNDIYRQANNFDSNNFESVAKTQQVMAAP